MFLIWCIAKHGRTVITTLAVQEIPPGTAVQMVGRPLPRLRIRADIASHTVVSALALDHVGVEAAPKLVVVGSAVDKVTASAAVDLVVAVIPEDRVVASVAVD